jgi:hypothetical protein
MQPILVGVVLALLVGTSSPWWWNEIFAPGSSQTREAVPDEPAAADGPGPAADDGAGAATDGTRAEDDDGAGDTTARSGCQIVIENPLVTLYEDTDPFGLEAGRASPGSYPVQEIRTVTFAGNPQRWFRITSGAVTGWMQDDAILVAAKSGECR